MHTCYFNTIGPNQKYFKLYYSIKNITIFIYFINRKKESGCTQVEKIALQEYGI